MNQPHAKHVPLPVCPSLRHLAHPGYTCAEEDATRARIADHCGPQALATLPARVLAGTTFGPGARNAA